MNANERRLNRMLPGLVLISALLVPLDAAAQSYPTRPIRLIVPYTAGGSADIMSRAVAHKLGENLGRQVVVDNRAGANTIIAAELMAHASPDGYTLLLGNSPILSINPVLYRKLPYDPAKDFAPITQICAYWFGLVAHPALAANSVPELIALARAKPDQIAYGSPGNGSPVHLGGTLLGLMAEVKMMHVPYKGAAQSVLDVMSGQLHFTMTSLALVLPYVKIGKLKLLAVTSDRRLPSYPDLPTVAEAGYQGFQAGSWFSVVTRAGTQRSIIDLLNREIIRVLKTPDVKERLEAEGYDLIYGTPQALARFIQEDTQRWAQVQKAINLRLDY